MQSTPIRLGLDVPRQMFQLKNGWCRRQLPPDLGLCYSEHLELETGLALIRLHYHPRRPLIEETACPHQGRVLVVTLGVNGVSAFYQQNNSDLSFKAGHTTISTFANTPGERHYKANQSVSQLRLAVNEVWLQRYLGDERCNALLGDGHLHQLAFHHNSMATNSHIKALNRHNQPNINDMPNKLNAHIHALSLLAEQFEQLVPEPCKEKQVFSTQELERVEQARNLMNQNLDIDLTLSYLSHQVGLSEHKLKQGFQYLYNTSPKQLLTELRMHKAHTLLTSGYQVAQTAWMVGYRYPNNFSVAFTRFFGHAPKSVKSSGN